MRSRITVVGRLASATLLRDITDRLRALGHDVASVDDAAVPQDAENSLVDADVAIVAPSFPCTRAVLALAGRLRGIVSPITGIEGIDLAAATELGIVVANGQVPENTESMAEATILLMLATLYDLHGTEAILRHGLPRPARMTARMLQGKTIGFIGFGQIARAMAHRLGAGASRCRPTPDGLQPIRRRGCNSSISTRSWGRVTWCVCSPR